MSVKALSHPGRGNSKCWIVGNWTRFSFVADVSVCPWFNKTTSVADMAHHVHIKRLLADFPVRRWRGMVAMGILSLTCDIKGGLF